MDGNKRTATKKIDKTKEKTLVSSIKVQRKTRRSNVKNEALENQTESPEQITDSIKEEIIADNAGETDDETSASTAKQGTSEKDINDTAGSCSLGETIKNPTSSTPKAKSQRKSNTNKRASIRNKTETVDVSEKNAKADQNDIEASDESDGTPCDTKIERSKRLNTRKSHRRVRRNIKPGSVKSDDDDGSEETLSESDNSSASESKPKRKKLSAQRKQSLRKIADSNYKESDESNEFEPQKRQSLGRKRIVESNDEDEPQKRQSLGRKRIVESNDEEDTTVKQTSPSSPKKTKTNDRDDEVHTNQTPKRRRGRPKKMLECEKYSDCTELSTRSPERCKTQVDSADEEDIARDSKAWVTCQVCRKEMTSNEFGKKHRDVHYGLCWTQYDEPIDIYDPQIVLDILSLKRKQVIATTGRRLQIALSFTCLFCNVVKRSELGYYSHLLVCNRSEEEIDKANKRCEKCDKVVFLPHYRAHEMKHMKEVPLPEVEVMSPPPADISPVGGKRSAAKRAVSKISKITENLLDVETVATERKKKDEEFDPDRNEEDDDDKAEREADPELGEVDPLPECEVEILDGDVKSEFELSLCGTVGRQPLSKKYSRIQELMFAYKADAAASSAEPLYERFPAPRVEWLASSEADDYLPRTKSSMRMKYSQKDNLRLDLFSTERDSERSVVLFCGGPVFAMAWCPHPLSLSRSNEFLAIASQPDIDLTHKKNVPQSYKSVIQIWKFPQLSCLESAKFTQSPKMVFGIAHEEGAVWNLEWCPSGGYIERERLGLVAAACSSGRILVYSVPWINDADEMRLSLLRPALVLQVDDFNASPCYRLAWQHTSPHHLIYAGYGDGCVALFDIQSVDAIRLGNNILLPINLFQAHLTEILVLSLCLCEGTFLLLTAANDRLIKVWDLTDVSSPIQVVSQKHAQKRPTCGGFIPLLPVQMTGSDHTHFDEASSACLAVAPTRDFAFAKDGLPRVIQTVAHFTLAFSKYCCSLLTGNENGEAAVTNYCKHLFTRKKEVAVPVLHSKLITLTNEESDADSSKDCNDRSSNGDQVRVSTYEDVCRKYKIDFVSRSKPKADTLSTEECDVVNVTSSCWNNNANNFQIFAVGQKCGLVHVMKANSHSQYQLDSFASALRKHK